MNKCLIIPFFVSLLFSCTNAKKDAKEHLAKATDFFKKEDYSNATMEVEAAFKLDSTNYDIHILKAKILNKSNHFEDAIEILQSQIPKNFKQDTVNFLIGDSYFDIGFYHTSQEFDNEKKTIAFNNAIKYYDYGLKHNAQYYNCYLGKQRALHNLGNYDKALITLNSALLVFPDSTDLVFSRGVEKNYMGDKTGAMSDLNSSIRSNKLDSITLSDAYRFRGYIYFDKGDNEEAISDLTIAISYDPKNELAYLARAGMYKSQGAKDLACEDYRKCGDLGYVAVYKIIEEYCGN